MQMKPHAGNGGEKVLSITGLTKNFKGLTAVNNYHLDLLPGEIVGLIGPNGAGKTTVFNLITGIFPATGGTMLLRGRNITNLGPDHIARLGIGRTFQNIRLFTGLTVLQNLLIAVQMHKQYGFLSTILSLKNFSRQEKELVAEAQSYLDALGIGHYRDQQAGNLPYGAQRKLEIARALATKPHVLLLDEPAAGMNPQESLDLMHTIHRLRKEFNITIILIEHDMQVVMSLCERLQVLSYGKIIAEGTPAQIRNNPTVIDAYLGRSAAGA